MKSFLASLCRLTVIAALATASAAHAGLSLQLDVIHNVTAHVYTLAPNLSVNTNGADSTPITYDEVYSPNLDTNGQPDFTGGVGDGSANTRDDFSDSNFNAFINAVTNGAWTLVVNVGDRTQHTYTFTVSSTLASNLFINTVIDFPPDGATNVPPLPDFEWQGPTNADSLLVYVQSDDDSVFQPLFSLPATVTNTTLPPALTNGDYRFVANYTADISTILGSTTPMDASHNPAAGWVSTGQYDTGNQSDFTVLAATAASSVTGHTNMAHYAFDSSNLGLDSSPNGNNINAGTGWGPGEPGHTLTTNAIAGGGAIQFFGFTSLVPLGQVFTNLQQTLTGSFSVSVWINTTNMLGNDNDPLNGGTGQSIVDFSFDGYGTTPVGLTGSKLAFLTIDPDGFSDTLHSTNTITTGQYVHVVCTRNQMTGEKRIYVNGVLDSSDAATTEALTGNGFALIGGYQGTPYTGLIDDLQFYTGVLNAADVSFLYANPGQTIADAVAADPSSSVALGAALDDTNLTWSTSGDADWFAETTNTYDGISAVQSGSLLDSQTSVLQTTVVGPGTITFFWQTAANDDSFDLEFDINGDYKNDIAFSTSWEPQTYVLDPGSNILTWTASTFDDSGSSTNDAGYVGDFVFTSGQAPALTTEPFDQTNYSGYSVWLFAAATGIPTPTWQWYKNNQPVANATNAYYVPADYGVSTVAGNYYAIGSNFDGTVMTRTAAVSFVSAPLPPDWSIDFKSVFTVPDDQNFFFDTLRDYYYNCVLDSSGNIYVAAEFSSTNQVGTNTLIPGAGGNAAAIVKQSPVGDPIWVQTITNNGFGHAAALAVATAPGDGVYVAGNFIGTNYLGTHQIADAGQGSIFIARFAANGSNVWIQTMTNSVMQYVQINTLVSDPAGNLSLIASSTNEGGVSPTLIQLDSNGVTRWTQQLPAQTFNLTYSAGRLYASVYNPTGQVFIGNIGLSTDRRWTVAAFNNTNGQALWLAEVGAPLNSGSPNSLLDDAPCLAVSGPNVFLIGRAYGSNATFGPYTVSWTNSAGDYVARYDTNGNPQSAVSFGSATTTPVTAIGNSSGGFYISGDFDTTSYFGHDLIAAPDFGPAPNGNFDQTFVSRFDSNGNPLWTRFANATFDTRQTSYVNSSGIALAPDGIWVSTTFRPRVEFGTNFDNFLNSNPLFFEFNLIFDNYDSGALAKITEPVVSVSPVTLINPRVIGGNFQFSFVSTAGHTNVVQSSTDLTTHSWLTYTNIAGDGTTKTIVAPADNPVQKYFRVTTE